MPNETGEPTHSDGAGDDYLPGSADLKSVISPASVKAADDAWTEHYKDNQQSDRLSSQNPNISDPYSPLNTMIESAYLRYGNMSVETLSGSVRHIMLGYANRIIEDIRSHPYGSLPALNYYTAITETRPIPDEIMISGLTSYYAKWMRSIDWRGIEAEYLKALNGILYQRKYGSGKPEMSTVDKREK